MAVRFFYVDESYDSKKFCLSAISIRYSDWLQSFQLVRDHRRSLKVKHGFYVRQEIHARELVKGRGNLGSRTIAKHECTRIFYGLLNLVATLPNVWLFNVCLDVDAHPDPQITAWDRLLNRIERTMLEADRKWMFSFGIYRPRAMIFSDEGKDYQITQAFRKRWVFNPIPSRYGRWSTGPTKNITLKRIVEEPIFKKSNQSFLIQMADCVAFALLKRETPLTFKTSNYGVPKFFENCLSKVCFRPASPGDPLGIVRN